MSLSNPGKEAITIGYWGIRGLVEPSRLVLHYTKTPYTDKFYALSDAPDFSREEWLSEKFNLGLGKWIAPGCPFGSLFVYFRFSEYTVHVRWGCENHPIESDLVLSRTKIPSHGNNSYRRSARIDAL